MWHLKINIFSVRWPVKQFGGVTTKKALLLLQAASSIVKRGAHRNDW